MSFTASLYVATLVLYAISYARNRQATVQAFSKAKKAFLNILPDFLAVLGIIGLAFTLISSERIGAVTGKNSGLLGSSLTSVIGSVTLIPGFIAFPLAKSLLDMGASTRNIALFISTLKMVGCVTLPLESRYFGKNAALLRNVMAYLYCFHFCYQLLSSSDKSDSKSSTRSPRGRVSLPARLTGKVDHGHLESRPKQCAFTKIPITVYPSSGFQTAEWY